MEIVKNNIDDLNAVLSVTLSKEDYQNQIDTALENIRKKADIKGFRKGKVPMGLIKKQYGEPVLYEEINKVLQNSVNEYIQKEKLEILGYPLPVQKEMDWKADKLTFDFDLGLTPIFDLDLAKAEVENFKIVVPEEDLNQQIENIRKSYGDQVEVNQVAENSLITAEFKLVGENVEAKSGQISFDELSDKAKKGILKAELNQELTFKTKDTFKEDFVAMRVLAVGKNELDTVADELNITIKEIKNVTPAELNQPFFDKLYGEGNVKSEDEFRTKVKEEAEKFYRAETDKVLYNNIVENVIKNTKFDLPQQFLTKFILNSSEEIKTEEDAKAEFEKSEKGMRFQLIEGKIAQDNKITVETNEVKDLAKQQLNAQMVQFGSSLPEEEVDKMVTNFLQNKEQYQQYHSQVFNTKMFNVLKENVKLKDKEVTFKEFADIVSNK